MTWVMTKLVYLPNLVHYYATSLEQLVVFLNMELQITMIHKELD